jgi:hypothetical protein
MFGLNIAINVLAERSENLIIKRCKHEKPEGLFTGSCTT